MANTSLDKKCLIQAIQVTCFEILKDPVLVEALS